MREERKVDSDVRCDSVRRIESESDRPGAFRVSMSCKASAVEVDIDASAYALECRQGMVPFTWKTHQNR
jgi:hypothetical protein